MRFWDSSAVVPLLLAEPETARVRALALEEDAILAWWLTEVECASAVARREREGSIGARQAARARKRLDALRQGWSEILPREEIRARASRLLRVHPLRAADSLQLAAALVASDEAPASLDFVCLDSRLAQAAGREGFAVLPATTA